MSDTAKQPILLGRSDLTGRWYAVAQYKEVGSELIEAGEKHDITDQMTTFMADNALRIETLSEALRFAASEICELLDREVLESVDELGIKRAIDVIDKALYP